MLPIRSGTRAAPIMNARPTRPHLPLMVALAALMLSLLLANAYPLLDPDEGRNAEVAREMAVDGDVIVPHLAGMPYLDKPPALYWLASAGLKLFGNEPWVPRAPAAVAAAVLLALVVRRGQRFGGDGFALRAAGLLYTAPLFAVLSAYVIFDMLLALCVAVVWLGMLSELDELAPETLPDGTPVGPQEATGDAASARALRRTLMFAALTAGILVKGPVMLAWAIGGSLGAALFTRSRSPLVWLAWWPGWLMLLGLAGGWFALATRRFPEYPRYAFLEESLGRMTTNTFHRQQPFWFAPVVVIAGALPWSLGTPWSRNVSRESRAGLGFVAFALLFFTVSHSKLVTYLLPCLPMLAYAAAEAWSDPARAKRGAWGLAVVYGALALVAAAAGWGGLLERVKPALDASAATAAKVVAGCFAYVVFRSVMSTLGRQRSAFVGALLFTPVLLLAAAGTLFGVAGGQSGAPLARAIEAVGPGAAVRYESCYSPGTDFLLGRVATLVSADGHETTSEYQTRYRETLARRGQWTALAVTPAGGADVVVLSVMADAAAPAGFVEFFRDRRFVAFRRDATSSSRGGPAVP
ncbi:MAG: ArnT family glycosyltransferase [Candidatus Eisenbacteria bacterium]